MLYRSRLQLHQAAYNFQHKKAIDTGTILLEVMSGWQYSG